MSRLLIIPRYSPKPIEAYSGLVRGVGVGPAFSAFLKDDAEAWNLAWLSHDYEAVREPMDGRFSVLVRRSVNLDLFTGQVDITGAIPARRALRGLLRLPPAAFLARARRFLRQTPLYEAYGSGWLELLKYRALQIRECGEQESGLYVAQANEVLSRIFSTSA